MNLSSLVGIELRSYNNRALGMFCGPGSAFIIPCLTCHRTLFSKESKKVYQMSSKQHICSRGNNNISWVAFPKYESFPVSFESYLFIYFLSQTQTHTQLTKKTYLDTDSQFLSHPDRKAQTEFPCILLHRFILYVVYRAQNTNNFFLIFKVIPFY